MKIASILAGVAIAALSVSAASADVINRGQHQGNSFLGVPIYNPAATTDVTGPILGALNLARSLDGNTNISAWHALGGSADDVGDVGADHASFTLKGKVSADCVYYSGDNNSETFDFGTLGIYAGDNTGPNAAFTMVSPAVLVIQTNLAGCNTNNTVSLSRTAANMTNNSAAGFNNAVFTNELPYQVTAAYQGASQTAGGGAAVARSQVMAFGVTGSTENNGAWKSPLTLSVLVDSTSQALLAGDYEGTFTLTLTPTL